MKTFRTFGFPIKATFTHSSSSSLCSFSGKLLYISSKTSPIPDALTDETACGSPNS